MADRCRSCDAPITWAITEKGRRIPLDPEPVEGGNVVLQPVPGRTLKLAVMVESDPGKMRHVAHFVTCPNAHRHRKRDRRENDGRDTAATTQHARLPTDGEGGADAL